MIRLARPFSDGVIFQRGRPIPLWGSSDEAQSVTVRLNGETIADAEIPAGDFSITLPPQEVAENAILEIGDVTLRNVDIGEVWVAGGQSNMEFFLEYTEGSDAEIASANDEHLRMYTVGQYSFAGEREKGYKAWNPWDEWLPYTPENAGSFSAVGVYFAKELRRILGVPVGIISCNWGGTSASAWLDRRCLEEDTALRSYIDDFDALVAKLDLERYNKIKALVRPGMASREAREQIGFMNKYTYRPGELERMMMTGAQLQDADAAQDNPLAGLSIADIMAIGPGDPNEPGALYENMLKEIAGVPVRGVIWYQGETDEPKAELYAKLFASMRRCWQDAWRARNSAQNELPFLTVQLAPFGLWRGSTGDRFPIVREQQELAAKTLSDVYMTSISDLGNVFDIHPKVKQPAGERLARLARKYIYGEDKLLADAPEAADVIRDGDTLRISFANCEGLAIRPESFESYNGFLLEEIPGNLLPPVLGGVNGLRVLVDGKELSEAECSVSYASVLIRSAVFRNAQTVRIEFAQTGFYQVNLFNGAGIPAKPFILEIGGTNHV